jgi:hypothetical protein
VFALLLAILVVLLGLSTLVVSIRWISKTNGAPWTSSYRRYGDIDQRSAAPIGIGIDTIYIAAGFVTGADVTYWVGLVAIIVVQAAMVALILVVVHRRNTRRRRTR